MMTSYRIMIIIFLQRFKNFQLKKKKKKKEKKWGEMAVVTSGEIKQRSVHVFTTLRTDSILLGELSKDQRNCSTTPLYY